VPCKLIEIKTVSGAALKNKSAILAISARWREINVPEEQAYRNHGVAYRPHCDRPIFQRQASCGAGLVSQVTLIEFGVQLRADAVLQRKLHSLSNATLTHFLAI